ncbi:hypothetical protein [Clavibacter michiganensis]|uniref:hypothetical protein n=1 Tax=Clavibacter michiganensis TaxID=28447 RepID=UPI000A646C9B|nr:hypothetical protein [Clavibacter michiganensis]AWF99393.1 hypothetical protein BEH61_12860 [Clavibacter michiganensis subsp. insidiosus]AWG00489.1 hypothetical protein BEH62_02625 [Clavibacter michiganensis subsp. insidiosus]
MTPAPAVVHVAVARVADHARPVDRAARTAAGRAALRALAAEIVGEDPADVTVRARCATCGGAHGRPVLGGSRALDGLHDVDLGPALRAAVARRDAAGADGPLAVDVRASRPPRPRARARELGVNSRLAGDFPT